MYNIIVYVFFRVEAESSAPSRTDVLSHAEAARGNTKSKKPSQEVTANSKHSLYSDDSVNGIGKGETNPSDQLDPDETSETNKTKREGKYNTSPSAVSSETHIHGENLNSEKDEFGLNDKVLKTIQPHKGRSKEAPSPIEKLPYLSEHNLEVHRRILREAWIQLADEDIELFKSNAALPRKNKMDQNETKINNPKSTKAIDMSKAKEVVKAKSDVGRIRKPQRQVVQRSTDFIFQKSNADSYSTLHIRKQKYSQQSWRRRVVKAKSSEELHRAGLLNEDIAGVFENERPEKHRGDDNTIDNKDKVDSSILAQRSHKYFTRGTTDRYKPQTEETTTSWSKSQRKPGQNSLSHVKSLKAEKDKSKTKGNLVDTEREDRYMMDMDFLAEEIDERRRQQDDNNTINSSEELGHKNFDTKSENSRNLRHKRLIALTADNKNKEDVDKKDKSSHKTLRKRQYLQNTRESNLSKKRTTHSYAKSRTELPADPVSVVTEPRMEPKPVQFVSRKERYKELEASLRPKVSKFGYLRDLRKDIPHRSRENKRVMSFSEIPSSQFCVPLSYGAQPKHYSFEAYVRFPRIHSIVQSSENAIIGKEEMGFNKTNSVILEEDQMHIRTEGVEESTDQVMTPKEKYIGSSENYKEMAPDDVRFPLSAKGLNSVQMKAEPVDEHRLSKDDANVEQQKAEDMIEHKDENEKSNMSENFLNPIGGGDEPRNEERHHVEIEDRAYLEETKASLPRHPSPLLTTTVEATRIRPIQSNSISKPAKSSRTTTKKAYQTYSITQPPNNKSGLPHVKTSRKTVAIQESRTKATEKETSGVIGKDENPQSLLMENTVHIYAEDDRFSYKREETAATKPDENNEDVDNAPDPDDVAINDKMNLEISIVDQNENTEAPEQVEQEKKKIKRFWEVVGGKDVNDGSLYSASDSSRKEKAPVAKVTKERLMSGRSKSSKQSRISSVHNVGGNYNLTLEVTS